MVHDLLYPSTQIDPMVENALEADKQLGMIAGSVTIPPTNLRLGYATPEKPLML
jgi:hypothetical protein